MATFRWTILHVPDVDGAVEFYGRAFGFRATRHDEDGSYAELDTGGTVLAFASHDLILRSHPRGFVNLQSQTSPPCMELAFLVDDVEAAWRQAIAAGATPQRHPEWMPWGQRVGWVRDCNGILVELVSTEVVPPDEGA